MKAQFILIFTLFATCKTFAQNETNLDEYKHFRIHLDNRTNNYLLDIPHHILEGFCKGTIKAYYPKSFYNEVNFNDFLNHFRWNEPLFNESVLCGEDYCSNPSFAQLFNSFNIYLDFYSKDYLDSKTSLKVRKTDFVQLVYSVEYGGMIYNFLGPLFRLDELSKLIFVKNETNDAQPQNLKTVFDAGRFYSVQLANPDIKPNDNNKNNFDYNEN